MRRVEGRVLALECSGCGSTFPTFEFSGDTDMATAGLGSATAAQENAVAIGEMLVDELNDRASGLARFAERIGREAGGEFRAVVLLRAEVTSPTPPPVSNFREFRETYQPPTLIFGCPTCSRDAMITKSSSVDDYASDGGRLIVVGDLTIG